MKGAAGAAHCLCCQSRYPRQAVRSGSCPGRSDPTFANRRPCAPAAERGPHGPTEMTLRPAPVRSICVIDTSAVLRPAPTRTGRGTAMATKAIVGEKVGMTQVWSEDTRVIPVTVLRVEPARIVQVKTTDRDGYTAVQVTYGQKDARSSPSRRRATSPRPGSLPGASWSSCGSTPSTVSRSVRRSASTPSRRASGSTSRRSAAARASPAR